MKKKSANVGVAQQLVERAIRIKPFGYPIEVPKVQIQDFIEMPIDTAFHCLEQLLGDEVCENNWYGIHFIKSGLHAQLSLLVTNILDDDLQMMHISKKTAATKE